MFLFSGSLMKSYRTSKMSRRIVCTVLTGVADFYNNDIHTELLDIIT